MKRANGGAAAVADAEAPQSTAVKSEKAEANKCAEKVHCCKVNGRSLQDCLVCGGDNTAQADWNQPGVLALVCGNCGAIVHLAADVKRPPDLEVLKAAGAYSAELAFGCSKARAREIANMRPHDPRTSRKGRDR